MKNDDLIRRLCAATLVLALAGCIPPIDQEQQAERKVLFVRCMELAAKMPRQSDDDVADIVEACDSTAHYQAK